MKAVAAGLGLDTSIGYRWMQAARQAGAPKFARLIVAGSRPAAAIAIEVGGAVVRVEAGFDSELLREVVSALSAASR